MANNLELKDVCSHFGMREVDAAKSLKCSVTTLKKFCRSNNILRWPFRKVQALEKQKNLLNDRIEDEEDPTLRQSYVQDRKTLMKQIREIKNPSKYGKKRKGRRKRRSKRQVTRRVRVVEEEPEEDEMEDEEVEVDVPIATRTRYRRRSPDRPSYSRKSNSPPPRERVTYQHYGSFMGKSYPSVPYGGYNTQPQQPHQQQYGQNGRGHYYHPPPNYNFQMQNVPVRPPVYQRPPVIPQPQQVMQPPYNFRGSFVTYPFKMGNQYPMNQNNLMNRQQNFHQQPQPQPQPRPPQIQQPPPNTMQVNRPPNFIQNQPQSVPSPKRTRSSSGNRLLPSFDDLENSLTENWKN